MSLISILSPMIIISSIIFTRLLHPLASSIMLLNHYNLCYRRAVYELILILLYIVLVLFIYVASLASNESSSFSGSLFLTSFFNTFTGFMMIFVDPLLLNTPMSIQQSSLPNNHLPFTQFLFAIYNYTTMNLTLFIVLCLLTLIVVMTITNTFLVLYVNQNKWQYQFVNPIHYLKF